MHAVFFKDLNRRFPDIGRLIIDQAAPKERNLPRHGGGNLCRPATFPPMGKRLRGKVEDPSIPMHADTRFHQPPKEPNTQHPIGNRRHPTPEGADHIRLDQQPIAPAYPAR